MEPMQKSYKDDKLNLFLS